METKTVLEWLYFADADFNNALILNDAHRKKNTCLGYISWQYGGKGQF
jgi:hypothetical protein